MSSITVNGVEIYKIPLIEPEIKWIIDALEMRSTLYKADSFSYEFNDELKQKLIKKIKEEQ